MWDEKKLRQVKFRPEIIEKERNTQFDRRLREGLLIVILAISIFLLLALISYHATDPGWSRTGMGAKIANVGGYVGAWVADVLLCAFGYVAYVFPLMLVYGSWISFKQQQNSGQTLFILRSCGFFLILLATSALSSLHFIGESLPLGAGGVFGAMSPRRLNV